MHSRFLGQRGPCLLRQSPKRSQRRSVVRASLTNKGKRFSTGLVAVKRIMGEGSYGQVFEVFRLHCRGSTPVRITTCYAGGARWQRGTGTSGAEASEAESAGIHTNCSGICLLPGCTAQPVHACAGS